MARSKTSVNAPNFQTVHLERGKHVSPEHGVCVMELASMLAGERFSDNPRSVSRVVAAFLRSYNDLVDDERRQDLYRYAAESVGSRAPRRVERERAALCENWLRARKELTPHEQWEASAPSAARRREARAAQAAHYAASNNDLHDAALALVDALIALGAPDMPAPVEPAQEERRSASLLHS
ncbi:MAG TPA: hypothetical protein VE570_04410 [Thermoleophilaceae bacterium]|jgi:hypothetical protein|nr:hypothetical protein [Thermoleophilaceae bacterium]